MKPDAPFGHSFQPETQQPLQPSFRRRHRVAILIANLLVLMGVAAVAIVMLWPHKTPQQAPQATTSSAAQTSTAQSSASALTWKATVDQTALPLGDGKVSTTPTAGYVDSCTTNFRGGGAQHEGSWVNNAAKTWNAQTKVAVSGSVTWPAASYQESAQGANRVVTTNDLPVLYPTGTFPIARTDPAHAYDANPNHIGTQNITYSLPLNPTAANQPSCTGLGPIGVMNNGVLLYNALDDGGRDAVAHETQDTCDGHPDGNERYHYHSVPSCIRNRATGTSTLVGYALDGYGIYVERDSKGNLPTNADLDVCHGRTSQIMWNGAQTTMYHYDATLEYPYTVGCYHGTPVATQSRP